MPVIKVDNKQFALRPGQTRLGAGDQADVPVGHADLGVQAIVEMGSDAQVVIRRAGGASAVRVNGIPLVDPTPLIHGDKVEIAGTELQYAEDSKSGDTAFVSAADIAAILAARRTGPARATAATGGRLVSLVDGKEYAVPGDGIVIGRDASADVVVAQNEVSRKHAEVMPVADGYELRDFSANGVFVNGQRLERPKMLSRADIIRVGSEEFRFYADVHPTATPSAAAVVPRMLEIPPAPAPTTVAASIARATDPSPAEPVADRPALAVLEILNAGPSKGQLFEVRVPLAHVGRGAHNDIVLADESVSETHAKLQRREDGWFVVDMGSTNGTYVGGQRLSAELRLDGEPDVRFGGVKMLFRALEVLEEAASVPATRPVASIDLPPPAPARPTTTRRPVSHAASPVPPIPSRRGVSPWVWGVVALAVGAAVAFSLLNR